MVDDAGGHEEPGLEGGVVDDVEDTRHGRQGSADTKKDGDQTQVADGRIGQQPLEVMLEEGDDGPGDQGQHAKARHQVVPFPGAGQGREEARQEKDPRLDHGGGVQVARDGGRRRHGMGQPEMEGELGRLGEDPQQDQQQGGDIEGMGADQVPGGQHDAQVITAGHPAQEQDAAQQGQTPSPGNRQGHARPGPGILPLAPVADEQEGTQAGQFPEHQHLDQVFGQHHSEHGAHEEQQVGIETPQVVLRGEVIAGIEDDQGPDPQDEPGEEEPQPIQAKGDIQARRREPGEMFEVRLSRHQGVEEGEDEDGRHQHDQQGEQDRRRTAQPAAPGYSRRPQERQQHGQGQGHAHVATLTVMGESLQA